jgi:hypothetical protein
MNMHEPTLAQRAALMLAAISAAEDLARCRAAAEMTTDDDLPPCAGYLSQAHSTEAGREA